MIVTKSSVKSIMKRDEGRLFEIEKGMQPFEEKLARGEVLTDKEFMKRSTLDFEREAIQRGMDVFDEFIEELGAMTAAEIKQYRGTVREEIRK